MDLREIVTVGVVLLTMTFQLAATISFQLIVNVQTEGVKGGMRLSCL